MADLPTYEFTDAGLKQALEALGSTSAEIGASLETHGIKGERHYCMFCPVANYLHLVFPDAEEVEVHNECCHATKTVVDYVQVDHPRITAETPLAVANFVEDFDNGYYPQLDSNEGVMAGAA